MRLSTLLKSWRRPGYEAKHSFKKVGGGLGMRLSTLLKSWRRPGYEAKHSLKKLEEAWV